MKLAKTQGSGYSLSSWRDGVKHEDVCEMPNV